MQLPSSIPSSSVALGPDHMACLGLMICNNVPSFSMLEFGGNILSVIGILADIIQTISYLVRYFEVIRLHKLLSQQVEAYWG